MESDDLITCCHIEKQVVNDEQRQVGYSMKDMTSAIELLDREEIPYNLHSYPTENGPVAAMDVAAYFGYSPDRLFKTLVTSDNKGGYYVFCLPAEKRLDMKRAASIVGAKGLQMLKKEIFEELTGYTHGGCSPFGLRTALPIYVDREAKNWETIYVSGGKVGYLVEVQPIVLENLVNAQFVEFS